MLTTVICSGGTEVVIIFFLCFSAFPQSYLVALGSPESGFVLIGQPCKTCFIFLMLRQINYSRITHDKCQKATETTGHWATGPALLLSDSNTIQHLPTPSSCGPALREAPWMCFQGKQDPEVWGREGWRGGMGWRNGHKQDPKTSHHKEKKIF